MFLYCRPAVESSNRPVSTSIGNSPATTSATTITPSDSNSVMGGVVTPSRTDAHNNSDSSANLSHQNSSSSLLSQNLLQNSSGPSSSSGVGGGGSGSTVPLSLGGSTPPYSPPSGSSDLVGNGNGNGNGSVIGGNDGVGNDRGNARRRSTRHRNYLNRSQLHEAVVLPDGYGQ